MFLPLLNLAVVGILAALELEITGQVSDGMEAFERARQLQPDLILLDIGLPGLHGIEAARQIARVSPNSKILFVSQHSSLDIVEQAMRTGARVTS